MCSSDIFLGFIAIFFPPIAVWIKAGICSADSIINILLCMLGWLPGLIHAWYIISLYPEPDSDADYITIDTESGGAPPAHTGGSRVTYYYVNRTEADGEGLNARGRPVMYGTVAGIPAQQPKPREGMRSEQQQQEQQPLLPQGTAGGAGNEAPQQGGSAGEQVPPSYDQAVSGDNKVQR